MTAAEKHLQQAELQHVSLAKQLTRANGRDRRRGAPTSVARLGALAEPVLSAGVERAKSATIEAGRPRSSSASSVREGRGPSDPASQAHGRVGQGQRRWGRRHHRHPRRGLGGSRDIGLTRAANHSEEPTQRASVRLQPPETPPSDDIAGGNGERTPAWRGGKVPAHASLRSNGRLIARTRTRTQPSSARTQVVGRGTARRARLATGPGPCSPCG
jgi:hypothetical protein